MGVGKRRKWGERKEKQQQIQTEGTVEKSKGKETEIMNIDKRRHNFSKQD
jgi:hypothetical protein